MPNSRSSFRNVADMVNRRLQQLDPPRIQALWRHSVKYLVEYLVLKPL